MPSAEDPIPPAERRPNTLQVADEKVDQATRQRASGRVVNQAAATKPTGGERQDNSTAAYTQLPVKLEYKYPAGKTRTYKAVSKTTQLLAIAGQEIKTESRESSTRSSKVGQEARRSTHTD